MCRKGLEECTLRPQGGSNLSVVANSVSHLCTRSIGSLQVSRRSVDANPEFFLPSKILRGIDVEGTRRVSWEFGSAIQVMRVTSGWSSQGYVGSYRPNFRTTWFCQP